MCPEQYYVMLFRTYRIHYLERFVNRRWRNLENLQGKDERVLLTATDLQRRYQVGRSTAYQLLSRTDLPVVMIGARKYMLGAEFDAWLRSHALNAVSQ